MSSQEAAVQVLTGALAESERISIGRRKRLYEKAGEARIQWIRAEKAEAKLESLSAVVRQWQVSRISSDPAVARAADHALMLFVTEPPK